MRSSYCRYFLVLHNYFEKLHEIGRIFNVKNAPSRNFAKNVCETFQNSFRTEHPCGNASVSFSVSFVQPFKCRRVLKKFCSETLQGIHKNAPMTKSFCSKRIYHWCLLLNSVKCFEIILQNN